MEETVAVTVLQFKGAVEKTKHVKRRAPNVRHADSF